MRNFGLLLSFRGASADYFRRALNQEMHRRLGRDSPAPVMNVNCAEADDLLADEKWWTLAEHLKRYATDLAAAGVAGFMLGSLAWYRFAPELTSHVTIPLLHPVDALEREMNRRGARALTLGILAPALATHPGPLYDRWLGACQDSILVPAKEDAVGIEALGEQLTGSGWTRAEARRFLLRVIADLRARGARAIVIGTPEISAALGADELPSDCYDLPALQVGAIADWMLASPRQLSW